MPLLTLLTAAFRSKGTRTQKQQLALDGALGKVKPRSRKPKFECQYCNESKQAKEFLNSAFLPWNCQPHLTGSDRVCKTCLEAALSAQLDCKPLLDIGCPQCGTAWEPEDLRMLMGSKDGKRLREIDKQAQHQTFIPSELPDQSTLDDLLARGARLCPSCRFPFVKLGGCDSILCEQLSLSAIRSHDFTDKNAGGNCGKYFNVAYAPVLEDGKGRRAVNVNEDSNTDLW